VPVEDSILSVYSVTVPSPPRDESQPVSITDAMIRINKRWTSLIFISLPPMPFYFIIARIFRFCNIFVGAGAANLPLRQQKENFCLHKVLFLFIQAAGLAYHRLAKRGVYHQVRLTALVSHHAPACIFLRLDDIPQQVADDIQCFALMIYTPLA